MSPLMINIEDDSNYQSKSGNIPWVSIEQPKEEKCTEL
jgi:hypothetical protein